MLRARNAAIRPGDGWKFSSDENSSFKSWFSGRRSSRGVRRFAMRVVASAGVRGVFGAGTRLTSSDDGETGARGTGVGARGTGVGAGGPGPNK